MGFLVIIYARRAEQVKDIVREHPAATVGVYAFPAKGEPVCPGASRCGHTTWTRDIPGGYMRHTCGRRNRDWKRHLVGSLFDILGSNLLKRARTPSLFRNPEGWDAPTKKRAHPEG